MDDLDLEQLKQQLNGVSGGSVYDVDEIMREAGSDAVKGSDTSLKELMKSLGVDAEKTPSTSDNEQKTQPAGLAAPVTEEMMPAWNEKDDLSALFLAAEQTQALVDEQDAMSEQHEQEQETDSLEEQDDVFAQLFAQLGEIEQHEKISDPRIPEAIVEAEEDTDLMARLFQSTEEETTSQPQQEFAAEPEEQETKPVQTEYDALDEINISEPEPIEQPTSEADIMESYDEAQVQDDSDTAEEQLDEQENAENNGKISGRGIFARLLGALEKDEPVDEAVSEEELEEQSEHVSEDESGEEIAEEQQTSETTEEQTQPKQGFLNRLMGVFGLEIVEEDEEIQSETESEEASETELEETQKIEQEENAEPELEATQKIELEKTPESDLEATQKIEPEEVLETEPEENSEIDLEGTVEIEPQVVAQPELEELVEDEPEEVPKTELQDVQAAVSEQMPEIEVEEELDETEAEFRDILQREEEIGAEEETLCVPRPRPEDTPVISEEELAEFLSDVEETEQEQEKVSFEQLLRDNGVDVHAQTKEQKLSFDKFPEETTTVYVDVPIRAAQEKTSENKPPQLFDAEKELEQQETLSQSEKELPVQEEEPEPDPDWLNMPLEKLYQHAPSMTELRREGPVMAHEVLRQKEWIMARIRRYKDKENGIFQTQEEPEKEPEQPAPAQPEEDVDAIHAAAELRALLEQDAAEESAEDSVFPEGPADETKTEAAGQKETMIEVTATVREPESKDADGEDTPEIVPPESKEEKQQKSQPKQKKYKAKTAVKPAIAIPKNLNQESKTCRRRAIKQARRASVIAILTLICMYISCAADFSLLPLPNVINYGYHPDNVLIVFMVLMGISILLAYDVVWDGVQALLRQQPNLSTLVDLALVLNFAHCLTRLVSEGEEMPYACIVMLALFAQLRAQVSRSKILHYTYKVAGNAKQPMGLFYHDGPTPHVVKAPIENTDAFLSEMLTWGIRHKAERIFTVLSVVVAVVLTVMICVATGDFGRLIYVLAATVTGACQLSLICAMVMARSYSARRMQRNGTAAHDNFGVQNLAKARTVVLTDEDLFPARSIALERLELRSNLNDATALAYAAALMRETSLGHMLAEEVRTRYGAPLAARHVVEDVGGGVSGQVGGIDVLLGDERYMASHGIIARDIPEQALVLALDGNVAAVLVIDYQVPAGLFRAMQELTERKIHIWLHTRNHQITPELVQQKYALPAGMVTIPDEQTDRALRSPTYTQYDRICGLLAWDGFIPMSSCMTSAREEARVAPVGAIIGVCAALLCMLLMAYLCYVFVPEDAHPIRMLIYMVLCFIPVFFLENSIGKE